MIRSLAVACSLLLLAAIPARAQHDLGLGETRDIVPRYLLQDVNGRATTPEDHKGYYQLIAFGYTFCPDICPTTLTEMAAVLKELGPQAQRLRPIFISVDPERDTLQVLREYTAFFDPRIIGMTGSPALVSRAAQNFKVRYQKVAKESGDMANYAVDHSAGMYLLGPDGSFAKKFAYATPPAEIATTIRLFLEMEQAGR
ncbi:MAG: SCO family protein [Rhodocyclaceae bacterium]|jgi:protein SCO1/2|nr:SCO family protein [Rhodocyclaceae bacterium]